MRNFIDLRDSPRPRHPTHCPTCSRSSRSSRQPTPLGTLGRLTADRWHRQWNPASVGHNPLGRAQVGHNPFGQALEEVGCHPAGWIVTTNICSWTVLLTPSSRSVVFAQTDPLVYKLHLCPEFSVLWSISRLHGSMMLLLLLPSLAFGQVCSYDSFSKRPKLSRSANCAINCLKHVAGLRFWVSWRKWVLRWRTPVWSLLWVWRRSGGLHLKFIIRFEVFVAAFNTQYKSK